MSAFPSSSLFGAKPANPTATVAPGFSGLKLPAATTAAGTTGEVIFDKSTKVGTHAEVDCCNYYRDIVSFTN